MVDFGLYVQVYRASWWEQGAIEAGGGRNREGWRRCGNKVCVWQERGRERGVGAGGVRNGG